MNKQNEVTKGEQWYIQNTGSGAGIIIESDRRRIATVNLNQESSRWGDAVIFQPVNQEPLANANLIVTAVNACKSVNEQDPLAVAQAIPDNARKSQVYDRILPVFEELKEALRALIEYHQKYGGAIPCLVDALAALAHAKALEEGK